MRSGVRCEDATCNGYAVCSEQWLLLTTPTECVSRNVQEKLKILK